MKINAFESGLRARSRARVFKQARGYRNSGGDRDSLLQVRREIARLTSIERAEMPPETEESHRCATRRVNLTHPRPRVCGRRPYRSGSSLTVWKLLG